jgi:prepilin-type N-terminal cleavage/methylation domain-containing protein
MLTRRGFTMVELLVALVLMGIVSTAVYTLLTNNQRLYRQQTQRIELNDNLRSATAILPSDLRELNASDPAGSDIIEMTDSSITYKAMRNLYITCVQANGGDIYLTPAMIGLRGVVPEFDSLLVFADRRTNIVSDDVWLHVNVTQVSTGNNCPGGQPSLRVSVNPSIQGTDSVLAGYPVRGFEVVDVRRYVDASGVVWLGARRLSQSSGWSGIQPVVGPLQTGGFRLAYFDRAGVVTADPLQVARIAITVIGRTAEPVRLSTGSIGYLADSLITQVALRNNR